MSLNFEKDIYQSKAESFTKKLMSFPVADWSILENKRPNIEEERFDYEKSREQREIEQKTAWDNLMRTYEIEEYKSKYAVSKEKLANYEPKSYKDESYVNSIAPQDILYPEDDFEYFAWEKYPKEEYISLVEQFPKIENLKQEGYSIEEIQNQYPELSNGLIQGFRETHLPRVKRLEDKYILDGDGRHRTLAAKEANLDKMRVKVTGEYVEKEWRGDG